MSTTFKKPKISLKEGIDGNVFSVLGHFSKALKKEGLKDQATEMAERVMKSGSYEEALSIMQEYCDIN